MMLKVPLTFRKGLVDGGFKVGRSPIYQTVTATDGTIKVTLAMLRFFLLKFFLIECLRFSMFCLWLVLSYSFC